MKTSFLSYATIAATLFILLSAVYGSDPTNVPTNPAQNDANPSKPSSLTPQQAEILRRFDKNGDGQLDDEERAAAKAALRGSEQVRGEWARRVLQRFDANHDGKLEGAELDEAVAELSLRPGVIRRFDRNGDGKLDDVEKARLRGVLQRRFSGENAPQANARS